MQFLRHIHFFTETKSPEPQGSIPWDGFKMWLVPKEFRIPVRLEGSLGEGKKIVAAIIQMVAIVVVYL